MKRFFVFLALIFTACDLHLSATSGPEPDAGHGRFQTAARRDGQRDLPSPKVVQVKEAHLSTDFNDAAVPTVDATYHDLLTLNVTTTSGTYVDVAFNVGMTVSSTANSGLMEFQILVDGSVVPGTFTLAEGAYGGVVWAGSSRALRAVSPGAHVVKVQWQNVVNGSSKHLNASSNPNVEYGRLRVEEVILS